MDTYTYRNFDDNKEFIRFHYSPLFKYLNENEDKVFKAFDSVNRYYHFMWMTNKRFMQNRNLNYVKNMLSGTYKKLVEYGYMIHHGKEGRANIYSLTDKAIKLMEENATNR
jgi:predicted transcriptional regulator